MSDAKDISPILLHLARSEDDPEDFNLEQLPGNPSISETVEHFLMEKRKRIAQTQWPPGTTFECKQCGDCCTWNFILLITDEELNTSLRRHAKYPHGAWALKEERQILLQMPDYSFTGNIPSDQSEYILKTGRHWGYWVLNARGRVVLYNPTPCIHLGEDNLCGIYDDVEMTRPRVCKVYFCRRHPNVLLGAEHYDYIFENRRDKYRCPPEESPYYPLWTAVLGLIKGPVKILDVGCGPGQFAELCVKAGHEYIGLDWSRVAIEAGREGPGEFHLVDLQKDRTHFKEDYDVATFVEFLEHVPNDLEILADVPQGRTVILTVPDYGGKEHFRFFKDLDEVTQRYRPIIAVNYRMILSGKNPEDELVNIFILRGTRR